MAKITGIDVSEWQKSIDWAAVKSQIDFAILREGYRKMCIRDRTMTMKLMKISMN